MSAQPLQTIMLSGVRHADNYARFISGRPDVALLGVYESPDAPPWAHTDAARLAEKLGLPVLDTIPSEADLAVVCSEPTRHAACAREALDAGLHVLIDKPAATTLEDAIELRDISVARGLICTVMNRSLTSSQLRARSMVDAGHIGFARSFDIEFLSDGAQFSVAVERPELVVDPALSGGGEIMNFFGYCVDTARLLTGCDPIEVYALAGSNFSPAHRAAGVEDIAIMSMLFTNGLVGTVTVGRIPSAPSAGPGASSVRLVGSHGHLVVDDGLPSVALHRAAGPVEQLRVGRGSEGEAFARMIDTIRDAIVHGAPLAYSLDDAIQTLAAIEAAYRSVESGQPELIPQPVGSSIGNQR